jgi:hypothetical protein
MQILPQPFVDTGELGGDGKYIDITFNDYSKPGPESISFFESSDRSPLYVCDIDDTDAHIKVLRPGHMLVSVDGQDIPNTNSAAVANKLIEDAERPFTMRFWEHKSVPVESKTGAELGKGIKLVGSDTRSLTIADIEDDLAAEFPELREGMLLKSLGGQDVTSLLLQDVDLILKSDLPCEAEFVPQQCVESLSQYLEDEDEEGDGDGTFDTELQKIEDMSKQSSVPIAIQKFDVDHFNGLPVAEQADLMWCLNSGLENPDSGMGCYACQQQGSSFSINVV